MLLDTKTDLSLRPLKYPHFYDMYRASIKNTWTVDEIDWTEDLKDLRTKVTPGEAHLIKRLVAFFATGDNLVAENVVLNLYKRLNAPEARMYLSRQLAEEALHIQFYLDLLDTYIPDDQEKHDAFQAVENIPSIRQKALFAQRVMYAGDDNAAFLRNLITYSCAIEGMFFYAAFAYVYFLRSKGLLGGLATGTNWVFRDESMHMAFALEAIEVIRTENPELFDGILEEDVREMLREAIDCELQFAEDLISWGVIGLSYSDIKTYLEYIADQRLVMLHYVPEYGSQNPFPFLDLQDVQELSNFFERRVSSYQSSVGGSVSFSEDF